MSLSNMKVFQTEINGITLEKLAQKVDKFNSASAGAIVLTSDGFAGDYRYSNFYASLASARRRVDRYATNADQTATNLAQLQEIGVKVAGGFGPILWEPGQMAWVGKSTAEALDKASEALSDLILQDQLNTAIAALVAAIEAGTTNTVYDGNTGPLTYADLNNAHALFGDHSTSIIANVMDGAQYHSFIGQNLANAQNLFQAQGVNVVDVLGRRIVVTDAPALRETPSTVTNDVKVLGLVSGAATVYDGSELITNVETANGKERITTTFQADYTFGLALKGYAWDVASGGKSPSDAELATGSNWDKVASSWKHTAGVMAVGFAK